MGRRAFLGVAWFGRFKTTPAWAALVAALNLGGVLYGLYYYLPQLARTPVTYWPFVPDSPLAVLWALLALAAYWLHRWRGGSAPEPEGLGAATLDALAVLGNVQVGAWTVYVLVAYADAFDTFAMNVSTLLLVSHASMMALGLLFLHGMRERVRRGALRVQLAGVGIAAAYYLVQDWLDYFGPDFMDRGCAMRPHTVPCDPHLEAVLAAVTFALTAAVSVGLVAALLAGRRRASDGGRGA